MDFSFRNCLLSLNLTIVFFLFNLTTLENRTYRFTFNLWTSFSATLDLVIHTGAMNTRLILLGPHITTLIGKPTIHTLNLLLSATWTALALDHLNAQLTLAQLRTLLNIAINLAVVVASALSALQRRPRCIKVIYLVIVDTWRLDCPFARLSGVALQLLFWRVVSKAVSVVVLLHSLFTLSQRGRLNQIRFFYAGSGLAVVTVVQAFHYAVLAFADFTELWRELGIML